MIIFDRIGRERRTVELMIRLYCRDHHRPSDGLCPECDALFAYANKRLELCPHERKPTCSKCPIHCYRPEMRLRVKEVMRYSGPRMLLRHPVLAVMHSIDGMRGKV
ncbi:MAG: nitrous oxide-stimulated promoter family protein [Thermodesulfovibrionales bacterium]